MSKEKTLLEIAKDTFASQEALDVYEDSKFGKSFLADIFKKEIANMNKSRFEDHLENVFGDKISIKEYLQNREEKYYVLNEHLGVDTKKLLHD